MPTAPPGPCRYRGCPNLQMPGGHGYCEQHERNYRWREAKEQRKEHDHGYDGQYRRTRRWVLTRQPLCMLCRLEGRLTAAEITHHLIPLAQGGTNSSTNLISLCKDCHVRLHGPKGAQLTARLLEVR